MKKWKVQEELVNKDNKKDDKKKGFGENLK